RVAMTCWALDHIADSAPAISTATAGFDRGWHMSGRVDATLASTSPQPRTAAALLRMLHIHEVSVAQQEPALRACLRPATPTPQLQTRLRRNGYGGVKDDLFGRHPLRTWEAKPHR